MSNSKAEQLDPEGIFEALDPILDVIGTLDLKDPISVRERLAEVFPVDSPLISALEETLLQARDQKTLLPKEVGGIRFGRLAKDRKGFSIDVVEMDGPGPKHRHPKGEIDLCFSLEGEPTFDGQAEGWVVYGEDSSHIPTVQGGRMLILYLLPGGAFELL
jgi:hypothetical protein